MKKAYGRPQSCSSSSVTISRLQTILSYVLHSLQLETAIQDPCPCLHSYGLTKDSDEITEVEPRHLGPQLHEFSQTALGCDIIHALCTQNEEAAHPSGQRRSAWWPGPVNLKNCPDASSQQGVNTTWRMSGGGNPVESAVIQDKLPHQLATVSWCNSHSRCHSNSLLPGYHQPSIYYIGPG
ncbi:hypothetical protein BaRGS_00004848 [Batillaria attramentaria]|uniref:Uncharacterized protein n=1 Tax=Batillaria attramentaria TaxID=370345 RepID=A0ABD0LW36_9CAEN